MGADAPTAAAVLVAAGRSLRMRAAEDEPPTRKPRVELGGRPLLELACAALDDASRVREVVIVAHPDDVETFERWCAERDALAKVRAVVPGGEERADSVRIGARWTAFDVDVVCIHDAARPLVAPADVDRTVEAAHAAGAALLAVPVTDTIKVSGGGERVESTLERGVLWAAQTPQAFRARELRAVLARAEADGFRPTDDAALWERYVGPVAIVRGSPRNLKITTPDDLAIARALLGEVVRTR